MENKDCDNLHNSIVRLESRIRMMEYEQERHVKIIRGLICATSFMFIAVAAHIIA